MTSKPKRRAGEHASRICRWVRRAAMIAVSFLTLKGNLSAQTASDASSIPQPDPPYIQLPQRAAWVIQFSSLNGKDVNSSTSAAPATVGSGKLTEVKSEKMGEIKHDTFTYSDGRHEEAWYCGKYRLVPVNNGKDAIALDSTMAVLEGLPGDWQYSGGLPAVSWITKESYRGARECSGTVCYYFEAPEAMGSPKAWIDVKTRLPVQVQIGAINYKFEFKQASLEDLQLSGIYEKAWERLQILEKKRQLMQQAEIPR